jgi:hypothetical protein
MVKVIDQTTGVVHEREKAGPKTVGELIGELVAPTGTTATCYGMP